MKKIINSSDISPEEELLGCLLRRGLSFATAESCTGGMIAQRITSVAGASACFEGAVVSYSNDVKMKLLNVKKETLQKFGAVSVETAREMAEGVLAAMGADIAVSVTGIAGPSGGTPDKPVGCVCFGVCGRGGTVVSKMLFGEDKSRGEIRRLASDYALRMAVDYTQEEYNA